MSGAGAGENVPLVRIPRTQSTNKFTNKAEIQMPLGDGGSYFFLSNIIAGPGMLALPLAYQQGGWVASTGFTILFTALTVLCAAYVLKAVQFYKAKEFEEKQARQEEGKGGRESSGGDELLEIETLVRAAWPYWVWVIFQFNFILSMLMMAISSVHVVTRAVDDLCILFFHNTFAFQVLPVSKAGFRWACPTHDGCKGEEAFYVIDAEHNGYLITLGYIITMLIAVPFSIIDIVDWCQGIMYTISLLCVLEMMFDFWYIADDPAFRAANQMAKSERLTAWGYNLGLVIEVSFLTWCLSFSVPMWLEQTAEGVSINAALWWSCASRGILFIGFGFVAAAAFEDLDTMNVLDVLRTHEAVKPITQVCGFLFAATCVFPNILAHSAAVRRNLETHVGVWQSNLLGTGVPWAIAWVFYFGAEYNALVNYASVYLNGVIQFLLPALLFLAFSASSGAYICRIAGIRLKMTQWQTITKWVAGGLVFLIAAAYILNGLVAAGVYGPNRVHSSAPVTSDYGDGDAYSDAASNTTSVPPSPSA